MLQITNVFLLYTSSKVSLGYQEHMRNLENFLLRYIFNKKLKVLLYVDNIIYEKLLSYVKTVEMK